MQVRLDLFLCLYAGKKPIHSAVTMPAINKGLIPEFCSSVFRKDPLEELAGQVHIAGRVQGDSIDAHALRCLSEV